MDKHTFQSNVLLLARCTFFKANAIDHTAVTCNFGGLSVGVHGHVGQAVELVDQHGIGFELIGKFNDGDMRHDACQIDGGFYARVTPANDGRAFAFEQGAIAMRAIGHAFVFVFLLARYIDIAPARASGQNDCAGFQDATIFKLHLNQTAVFFSRNYF